MKNRSYFLFGVIAILLLQFLDIVITYWLDPELYFETNVFVTSYGMGWLGIVIVSILQLVMVIIPFYFYSLVFQPEIPLGYKSINALRLTSTKGYISWLFKCLFSIAGLLLFWIFFFSKIYAISSNLLIWYREEYFDSDFSKVDAKFLDRAVKYYSDIGEARRNQLKIAIVGGLAFLIILLNIIGLIRRFKNQRATNNNSKFYKANYFIFFFLYILQWTAVKFAKPTLVYDIELTEEIDKDIAIVNIGHLNRYELGETISKINKGDPALVIINAYFPTSGEPESDSILLKAVSECKNDLLAYYDSADLKKRSFDDIRNNATWEGLVKYEYSRFFITHFKPIRIVQNDTCVSLSLMAVKALHPDRSFQFKVNQTVPIEYWKRLVNYANYEVSDFEKYNGILDEFKNKIVILGFIGPGNEDKYYTPIGDFDFSSGTAPDTYGSVILANEIKTLLNYRK